MHHFLIIVLFYILTCTTRLIQIKVYIKHNAHICFTVKATVMVTDNNLRKLEHIHITCLDLVFSPRLQYISVIFLGQIDVKSHTSNGKLKLFIPRKRHLLLQFELSGLSHREIFLAPPRTQYFVQEVSVIAAIRVIYTGYLTECFNNGCLRVNLGGVRRS